MTSARALAAVIFDLDGVLIDSETVWDQARRQVAKETGGRWLTGATTEMLGMSAPEWSRYMHERLSVPLDPSEINALVVTRVREQLTSNLPLMTGAIETVERIATRWPVGLASSSNRAIIDAVLDAAGLSHLFGATVSSEEVQRGKPAPDVYLAATAALHVRPERAAAIEDSSNGIRSAAAAGMTVAAIPNRHYPPSDDALALADLTLTSLEELTAEALIAATRSQRQS